MSSSPAETEARIRALFAAFAARDEAGMLALMHPEGELFAQPTAEQTGRREPYRGAEGFRAYLRDVDRVWERFAVDPGDLRVAGGGAMAFGWVEGTPRGGEPQVRVPCIWVIRERDGLIFSIKVARTAAEAQRLAR